MTACSKHTGEIFNVGSGNTYSINYLVSLLDSEIIHIPRRPGEPDCTFANTKKIQQMIGWSASTNLATGVKEMLDNIQLWEKAPIWDVASINEATRIWFEHLDHPPEYQND